MKNRIPLLGMSAAVIIGLLVINWFLETQTITVDPKTDYAGFKMKLEKIVPVLMKKYRVPGTAVGIVRNEKTDFLKGYGWADIENKVKINENTVFQVASNSKTVTAWGVMLLVEKGKLNLDAPVMKYLTRWKLPPSRFNNDNVTLRRILSHTAGLSPGSYAGYPPGQKLPTLEQSLSGALKGAEGVHLTREPGLKYKYSGGGYVLAQLIIEEATGKSFAEYMEEAVLKPLGMKDSSFELNQRIRVNLSKAYGALGGNLPNYLFTEQAAAGLYTNVSDFSRFIEENLAVPSKNSGEKGVISRESFALMLNPIDEDYGLGYIIKELPDGTRLVYHGGTNRGWRSQFAFLPERGDGLVVLTNSENGENLHRDLVSLWTKWETGFYPDYRTKIILLRVLVRSAALIAFLLLAVNIWELFKEVRSKRKSFILSARLKSGRGVGRVLAKCLLPLLLSAAWVFLFYTGTAYKGWTFASFMPSGFLCMTVAAVMWGVFLSAGALFTIDGKRTDDLRQPEFCKA